ncbi:hypothetical protein [Actinokineospora sp. HUAS TT18]|uniref:hypothetical protein n=1 Tax=Actinokineospora sp. HUAS TT18 TaxID=3447451 RepID=UPI003F521BED
MDVQESADHLPRPHGLRLGAMIVGCTTVAATCFGWVVAEIKNDLRDRGPVPFPRDPEQRRAA